MTSCSPRSSSKPPPRAVPAVRAHPLVLGAVGEPGGGRGVVDHHHATPSTRDRQGVAQPGPGRVLQRNPGAGDGVGHQAVQDARPVRRRAAPAPRRTRPGPPAPGPRRGPPRTSHHSPARRSARPKGRLSTSSLASTTAGPSTRGSSPRLTQIGPPHRFRHRRLGVGVDRGEREGRVLQAQGLRVQAPLRRRALDQDVAQRRRAVRGRGQHGAAQRAGAGAGVDHDERVGRSHVPPPAVERPAHHGAEQRPHLGAGEEVALAGTRPATGLVEPAGGVVERGLEHPLQRPRPVPADLGGDALGDGHGPPRGSTKGRCSPRSSPCRRARWPTA